MLKTCPHCGHPVGQGDRHSVKNCPPKFLGKRAILRARARRRAKKAGEWIPKRGAAVAGTGVPGGAKGGTG